MPPPCVVGRPQFGEELLPESGPRILSVIGPKWPVGSCCSRIWVCPSQSWSVIDAAYTSVRPCHHHCLEARRLRPGRWKAAGGWLATTARQPDRRASVRTAWGGESSCPHRGRCRIRSRPSSTMRTPPRSSAPTGSGKGTNGAPTRRTRRRVAHPATARSSSPQLSCKPSWTNLKRPSPTGLHSSTLVDYEGPTRLPSSQSLCYRAHSWTPAQLSRS